MDKYTRWVIAILSVQLAIASIEIARLSYKLGYEQGRASIVFDTDHDGEPIGTCLVPSGCEDTPATPKHKAHK